MNQNLLTRICRWSLVFAFAANSLQGAPVTLDCVIGQPSLTLTQALAVAKDPKQFSDWNQPSKDALTILCWDSSLKTVIKAVVDLKAPISAFSYKVSIDRNGTKLAGGATLYYGEARISKVLEWGWDRHDMETWTPLPAEESNFYSNVVAMSSDTADFYLTLNAGVNNWWSHGVIKAAYDSVPPTASIAEKQAPKQK